MKFALTTALLTVAVAFVCADVSSSAISVTSTPNLRKLEWGAPDNGKDGHDNRDHNHDNKDDHDRDNKDEHKDEKDKDEHDERDQRDKEEQERREQEEKERQREEEREREKDRFDCPPERPWLCAPTAAPTRPPTMPPTAVPTVAATTTGIFGSGVFGSSNTVSLCNFL